MVRQCHCVTANLSGSSMKPLITAMFFLICLVNSVVAQDDDSILGAWEWEKGGWVLSLLPGKYAVGTLNNVAMAVYEYRVAENRLYIRDLTPPPNANSDERDCVMQNEAVYGYSIEDDRLTLTIIEDACDGRAKAFTEFGYSRIETPDY